MCRFRLKKKSILDNFLQSFFFMMKIKNSQKRRNINVPKSLMTCYLSQTSSIFIFLGVCLGSETALCCFLLGKGLKMKIEHVAIYTQDLEGMRNFFENYFNATSNQLYHNLKPVSSPIFLPLKTGFVWKL